MLRSHAWDPQLVRLGKESGPWEVRTKSPSCDATVTCVLPVLCVFLRFLAQYSMNPYVYPTDSGRCPSGCSAGPCRHRMGFETTYCQSCRLVWDKYKACRTHKYGRLLDHAPLSTGPKSLEAHLWKLYMLIFQPRAIWPRMGPRIIAKLYKPAARSTAQSDQGFCYALNWQIRTQSFFIQTADSNQTELGAHAISVLSCTGSHITVVTYFHNHSLLACFETNIIKTSCFEVMSYEKWKQKCYIYYQCVLS